jgi:hypothetical protein
MDTSGADDGDFVNNHVTGAASSFQMDISPALGIYTISGNHFEPTGTNRSMIVRSGNVVFENNSDYTSRANALEIAGGSNSIVAFNLFNGNLLLDAGTADVSVYGNYNLGTVIDNSNASLFLAGC